MQNSSPNPSGLTPSRNRLIFALVALLAALAIALAAVFAISNKDGGSGVALVGGPFTLTNQRNETVTEKSFAGQYMLVFFGYTYCPDVCPTELQVMTAALAAMGPAAEKITPILVTVDPARDTPAVLAAYVENFSPRLQGLTGSPEQIAAMAKAYRVFYRRVENTKSPADYLMDHSSIIYLMVPDGKFLKHFSYTTDAAALAEALKTAING